MALTQNSLAGFLAVYAQKSLNAFLADMPPRDLFTENFDDSIANGGISVTTRIPTTQYSTLNDLGASGWETAQATASSVTINLATKGHDHAFNVTDWATITPAMLQNLYLPTLAKQTANGVIVTLAQQVTSSYFTSTMTVATSSNVQLNTATGSFAYLNATLTNNEIPEPGRYAIVMPSVWQGLLPYITQTYVYGSPQIVQQNGYGDGNALGRQGVPVLNFSVYQYPRLYGSTKPYGGDYVGSGTGTNDKLVGFAGHKQGLIVAMRSPLDMNTGLIQSYTAVDPTSKVSLQVVVAFDQSKPMWRLGTYVLFGAAAGNSKAIIPIITQST